MAEVPTEYSADEPFEGEFDVPDFIAILQDELQEVRTQIGKLEDELWPVMGTPYWKRSAVERYTEPDPIRKARIYTTLEPLRHEEERLQAQFDSVKDLLPPLLNPPHNGRLTSAKAKTILKDGEVRGHPLTAAQRRFFGFVAGGGKPTRTKRG